MRRSTEEQVAEISGGRSRWPSRLVLVVVWAVAVAAVYLVLTLAWPRTVPRLTVLPAPASEPVDGDQCGQYVERWEPTGTFWTRSVWSVGAGCINHASSRWDAP